MNDIIERVGEVADSHPNLDFGYIIVSRNMLADLIAETYNSNRFNAYAPMYSGFESLALQTHHGQLYVKSEPDLEYDDFVLMDRSGNRYSYTNHFLNELAEKILLKGDSL